MNSIDQIMVDAYRSKVFKGRSITNRMSIQHCDEPQEEKKTNEFVGELGETAVNTKDVIIPTLVTPRGKTTQTKMKIQKSLFRKHAFNQYQTKITS